MRVIRPLSLFVIMSLFLIVGVNASAQSSVPTKPDPSLYQWVKVVDQLDSGVYVTPAGGGSGPLFAVEQGGVIFLIRDGQLKKDPLLDITGRVIGHVIKCSYTDRGRRGLAFYPHHSQNRLL